MSMKTGRVLIVDDEDEVMNVFRDIVSQLGYEVIGYTSGKEALEALRKKKFDILMTDLMMPEGDGITLMRKALEINPRLVCIMLTGKGTVENAVEAMKVGAFDFILKPLKISSLASVLSRAIEVSRLRESEEKYRAIVEDQTELICRWRQDGTITFANEVYCRYFGIQCQEIRGQSFFHVVPEEDRQDLKEHISRLNSENPVATIEHHIIMPGGKIQWQQWTNRAIFDDRGNIIEFQSVGRDITDRKQAEEALKTSEDELKRRVAELEEFYQIAVGRELRMVELKEEIESLSEELEKYRKS